MIVGTRQGTDVVGRMDMTGSTGASIIEATATLTTATSTFSTYHAKDAIVHFTHPFPWYIDKRLNFNVFYLKPLSVIKYNLIISFLYESIKKKMIYVIT